MSVYFLAPLIGVVVGLRAMAAPAVVSWGGISPPNASGSAWLAFLGYAWPPYILSALAIAELISDQLPVREAGENAPQVLLAALGR